MRKYINNLYITYIMRRITYFALPLMYALTSSAFAADPAEVKAIRQYVLANGYVRTVHAGGSLTLSTILVPGKLVGLVEPHVLEVNVTQREGDKDSQALVYIMVGPAKEPLLAVVNNKNFLKYSDEHRDIFEKISKTFTDGCAPASSSSPQSLDGVLDSASDGSKEVDLKKEEARKHYQREYDRLIRGLYRLLIEAK